MKSRPTPANLYTTRRIGLQHWLDPESKKPFSLKASILPK